MPRGKRNQPSGKQSKPRKVTGKTRRKAGKSAAKAPRSSDSLDTAQAELVRKYPDRRFKPGSLRGAGDVPDFGHKRTIVLLCADCDAERRVATSDVFHVSRCVSCAKEVRKKTRPARKNTRKKGDAS